MLLSKSTLLLISLLLSLQLASAGYNPAESLEYAYASALSHCKPDAVVNWTCGAACKNLTGYQGYFSEVFKVTVDQTLAFSMILNPSTKKFVTTFRGTIGSFELLLEFIEGNGVPYTLTNLTDALVDEYFYNHYVNVLRSVVMTKLQAAYASFPDYQYVFTGHSLGAALATLAVFDVITMGLVPQNQTIMYNYGSPRVGNIVLVEAIQAAVPEIHRIVHWRDPVPHLPGCKKNASGDCTPNATREMSVETGERIDSWPAWHLPHEVFYNAASTNYTLCQGNEDPSCSDQFPLDRTDFIEHYHYVNVHMNCDRASEPGFLQNAESIYV